MMIERRWIMKKYTVYLLTPYAIYENIEAKNQKEAITKIEIPRELDSNEVCRIIAIEDN